jgi:hypothetical protein
MTHLDTCVTVNADQPGSVDTALQAWIRDGGLVAREQRALWRISEAACVRHCR